MFYTKKIVYFKEEGAINTETVLELVKERAENLCIKSIVVASTHGETGVKAAETFKGYNVVVVTHSIGFKGHDIQELTPENHKRILKAGGRILTTTHAFGGVGRAIRRRFNTYQANEIIANTLRIFGDGTKVAVEIALMAADAGLVSPDQIVLSIAGTSRGADTVLVVKCRWEPSKPRR